MLSLIRPRFALTLVIGLFAVTAMAIISLRIYCFDTPVWSAAGAGSSLALSITLLLISWPKSYAWLAKQHNRFTFLEPILDLNGIWRVEIKSNWPRIQAFSDPSAADKGAIPMKDMSGELTLQCNLFRTLGNFRVADAQSSRSSRTPRSDIVASSLRMENGHYIFSYIAKANVSDPDPNTDEQSYLFAAEICFKIGNFNEGGGKYWTNRKYSTGHNAAGEITLERIAGIC